ncbi:MAG: MBL fold metallo-hydrolase, partial [Bradyrhizobium sp.]|nr:MBL fold metallo-hydrolase [Bradyrhizobium sp.]
LATEEAVSHVRSLGGLKAIAVSHPHFYGAVADWSEAFGGVPVYLHADDRQWITRPHPSIVSWAGQRRQLSDDIWLLRAGVHFEGGTILHWRKGAEGEGGIGKDGTGKGALFTGDIAAVGMDRRTVSFMRSFPNYIPLGAADLRRIDDVVAPLLFDRIYGGWWGRNIAEGAKAGFDLSVRRYLAAITRP